MKATEIIAGVMPLINAPIKMPSSIIEQETYFAFRDGIAKWEKDIDDYYKANLPGSIYSFLRRFLHRTLNQPIAIKMDPDQVSRAVNKMRNEFQQNKTNLALFNALISESDVLNNPEAADSRKNLKISQIRSLILKKLYAAGGTAPLDVELLLRSNGVEMETKEQRALLLNMMNVDGHIYFSYPPNIKLTIEGKEFVEEELLADRDAQTTPQVEDWMQHIDSRLDEVVELLRRSNDGNEIIFDELESLKPAKFVLDKVNWDHLLKGKIMSLVNDKASGVTADLGNYIYQQIMSVKDNLLSS